MKTNRFFVPNLGSTVRLIGSMKKYRVVDIHFTANEDDLQGQWMYKVKSGRLSKWVRYDQMGLTYIPEWMRPYADGEKTFKRESARFWLWLRKKDLFTRKTLLFFFMFAACWFLGRCAQGMWG